MPDELKRKIDAHINELFAKLRVIAPKETAELLGALAARDGLLSVSKPHPDSPALPYVYFDSVIDAILHWFKTRDNQPATTDEIKRAVLEGGIQLHSPRRELNVDDSIDFHTQPKRNKGSGKLQKHGKLIQPK